MATFSKILKLSLKRRACVFSLLKYFYLLAKNTVISYLDVFKYIIFSVIPTYLFFKSSQKYRKIGLIAVKLKYCYDNKA